MNNLYKKLLSLDLLKRAWHLARNDSRTDFVLDPYRYNDFAFRLDDNLKGILLKLESGTYRPQPLIEIDVPKSSLSVRPGTVMEIEDRVVLFAILCLIAPIMDKKLPKTVYSYRLKTKFDRNTLFQDGDILSFPFLKKSTIQHRLQIFEPWYGQWPLFLEQSQFAYEKDGYRFLSISDISAYFENINLEILRDIFMRYLQKEQRIVNLLISIYETWVYETPDGRCLSRGIPQGNSISSFIGNIYLLPLDEAMVSFGKRHEIKYLRYMDDVKIFSKNEATARQVIFEMNRVLRGIHLNIQGSKTDILQDDEIKKDLEDSRLEKVGEYIKSFEGKKLTNAERQKYVKGLIIEYKKIKSRKKSLRDKDFRLFRRLITGFTLLQHSRLIERVILEVRRNPDYRLARSAAQYFRQFPNRASITSKILKFLESPENVFPQQAAALIACQRYMSVYPRELKRFIERISRTKGTHWYIKCQAMLLLAQLPLSQRRLTTIRKKFDEEKNIELRRTIIMSLCQLEIAKLAEFIRMVSFDPNPKIGRVGRMLLDLLSVPDAAGHELQNIFQPDDYRRLEIRLMDNMYKIEIIKHNQSEKDKLLKQLLKTSRQIKRPNLKSRISRIIEFLKTEKPK